MAADPPLNRLVLAASSAADDLGYVALHDVGTTLAAIDASYRIIGGHMVTALVARWKLGADLYRETGDTDLGVAPIVIKDHRLVDRIRAAGYEKVAGNRFARTMTDVPITVGSGRPGDRYQAVIDVLIPAYTGHARENKKVGDDLVTTEVLGLAAALKRPSLLLDLELHRLNGERLEVTVSFPDEVSAIVLKAAATRVRSKDTDVVDIWRCLEVGLAAGLVPDDFSDTHGTEAAQVVRFLFRSRSGAGMKALVEAQNLSPAAADQRYTRIQALMQRVLGAS